MQTLHVAFLAQPFVNLPTVNFAFGVFIVHTFLTLLNAMEIFWNCSLAATLSSMKCVKYYKFFPFARMANGFRTHQHQHESN